MSHTFKDLIKEVANCREHDFEKLMKAVVDGDAETVRQILNRDTLYYFSVAELSHGLWRAAKMGNLQIVNQFLEKAGTETDNNSCNLWAFGVSAAMHEALAAGYSEIVERLSEKGGNLEMMSAAWKGCQAVIEKGE